MILALLLAACDPIIGCIEAPTGVMALPTISLAPGVVGGGVTLGPIILLLNLVLKLVFVVAGLYAFFNLIFAGFGFIGAGGDAKAVSASWSKIMQTLIGIIVIVSSFLLSAIMGQIFFGKAMFFLQPTLILK